MEIDITRFFNEADPSDYSASVAERGAQAGKETWAAAVADSPKWPLLASEDEREEARDWLQGFGAWEEEEIATWTDEELNALLIQFISGDIREMESLCVDDWEAYRKLSERGTVSGNLYRGDDGCIYFYVGT